MARVLEKCNTGWIFWDVVPSDQVAIRGQFLKGTIVSLQQTELISLVFTIPQ